MRKSRMPSQLMATQSTDANAAAVVRDDARPSSRRASRGSTGNALDEELHRVSILPGLYSKDDVSDKMRGKLTDVHAAFKRPAQDPAKIQLYDPDRARKQLGMCRAGGARPRPPPAALPDAGAGATSTTIEDDNFHFEPLILWEAPPQDECPAGGEGDAAAPDGEAADGEGAKKQRHQISVDGILCRFLRPHQREGVQFLFDCTMALREYDGAGCILADDMGLGKTLQSITILWTLMCQGMDGKPAVTHTIVACPVSLVTNWESELNTKWIGQERLRAQGIDVIAVSEAKKAEVKSMVRRFTYGRSAILIISYETFRLHEKEFKSGNQCGLLICDEAHRLKNKETKTAIALSNLSTRRRVLLSGTPIQNDLDEFYSMVHFANPGLLGTQHEFHRNYQNPILRGREPDASDKDRERGEAKSSALGMIVNQFILRRTNTLLSAHLPPKLVCVVCCSLSELQLQMYRTFLSSKVARQAANGGKQTLVLASITSLKKLCNHPSLIMDNGKIAEGFEEAAELLPPSCMPVRGRGATPLFEPALSGKFHVLHKLLKNVRATTDDKVVLVSNYTQTLDLFERMCRQESWPCCKLDGSCTIKKRTKMVKDFNDPRGDLFAFLLSSKAGGCGLNLIGGNRLVLFDPDWNPANDKQAAARVWRDGQKKKCYLYRMLCAGSIEEKVFERQLSKEGLSGIATNEDVETAVMRADELRDLFGLHDDVPSHLHQKLMHEAAESDDDDDDEAGGAASKSSGKRKSPPKELTYEKEQEGFPKETGDMHLWGHHLGCETVDDAILRDAGRQSAPGDGAVSFTFSLQVQGALLDNQPKAPDPSKPAASTDAKENTTGQSSFKPPSRPAGNAAGATGLRLHGATGSGGTASASGHRPGLLRKSAAPPTTNHVSGKQAAPRPKASAKSRKSGSDVSSEEEEDDDEKDSDDGSDEAEESEDGSDDMDDDDDEDGNDDGDGDDEAPSRAAALRSAPKPAAASPRPALDPVAPSASGSDAPSSSAVRPSATASAATSSARPGSKLSLNKRPKTQ